MPAIVSQIEIARPPGVVFAFVTDPTRFPQWQHDVVAVRVEGPGVVDVGGRFTTVRQIGRVERDMTQQVTVRQEGRAWSVRGVDGPVRPNVDVTVQPLDDGERCLVTFVFDFDGHAMGRALLPLVRRMTARQAPLSVRRLKDLLEAPTG
jgi:uncharacterized protein YndB with AHSA1/START domain